MIIWQVEKWRDEPRPLEVIGETPQYYRLANGRREARVSAYHACFITELEAWRYIADRHRKAQQNHLVAVDRECALADAADKRIAVLIAMDRTLSCGR